MNILQKTTCKNKEHLILGLTLFLIFATEVPICQVPRVYTNQLVDV